MELVVAVTCCTIMLICVVILVTSKYDDWKWRNEITSRLLKIEKSKCKNYGKSSEENTSAEGTETTKTSETG